MDVIHDGDMSHDQWSMVGSLAKSLICQNQKRTCKICRQFLTLIDALELLKITDEQEEQLEVFQGMENTAFVTANMGCALSS